MTEQIISILVVALFVLLALIGLTEFIIRRLSRKEATAQSEPTPPAEESTPLPAEAPSAEENTTPPEGAPPADQSATVSEEETAPAETPPPSGPRQMEIARLSRDPAGNLLVEMDGQCYRSIAELNTERRERLLTAATALQEWLLPQAAPLDVALPIPPAPPPQQADSQPKSAGRPSLFKIIEQALETDVRKIPEQPESVAGQVNVIVQRMLQGTPLAERGIRLLEMPDHSLAVAVGLERYDSVDAVPDDAIRTLLKAAVAEWASQAK